MTVSLRVTDANGCIGEHFSQMVNVSSAPTVSVTPEVDQWCEPPLQVPFVSSVTTAPNVSSGYTLTWNFGDGQTGTGDNLTHTYNSHGHFDVSVTATDNYGCSTTQVYPDMISIDALVPRFDAPSVVCRKVSTAFRSLMSSRTNCQWNFGDGTPVSTDRVAYHTYMNEGTYTGTFTADPGGPCERSETFTVTVQYVEASFVVDGTFSCDYPYTVQFTNTSLGDDVSYRYDVGLGPYNLRSEENPEVTYNQNGIYETSFTAYTSAGCYDTFDGPTIVVNHPEGFLMSNSCGNCVPATISFDHDVLYTPNSEIVDFFWDFGDGTTLHTSSPPVNHTYTEQGVYFPTLTITDRNGCTATSILNQRSGLCDSIEIGIPIPPEDFGAMDISHNFINRDTVCPQDLYLFYNSMYASSDTIDFTWVIATVNDGNGGNANGLYNDFSFSADTGWNNVGIYTEYMHCQSETYWWDRVYVLPPILHFGQYTHCSAPFDFTYTISDNRGAQYWEWIILSDSDTLCYVPHSISPVFHYTYPDYGAYSCILIGHNDNSGCTFKESLSSNINQLPFEWHLDPDTVCMGKYMSVEIDDWASEFVSIAYDWKSEDIPNDELEWFDNILLNRSHVHSYDEGGEYTLTVKLRQSDGCISIYSLPIYVVDPASTLSPPPSVACAPANVEFECILTNTNDPIGDVQWNLVSGETIHGNPVSHEYADTGYYSIHYMVTTRHGCINRQSFEDHLHVIDVPDLDVDFDDSICVDNMVVFSSNVTNAEFSYTWDFGDGEVWDDSGPVVSHDYSAPGRYPVSLKVVGGLGCTDSITYPDGVWVESLEADLSPSHQNFDCYPAQPTFSVSATALPNGTEPSFEWNMGNGDILYVENPEYLYNIPGYYNISLVVTTPSGCRQVKNTSVLVSGPTAEISISDTAICAGDDVTFRMVNAQNVQSYQWVVGGGYNYTTPTVTHTYDYVPQSGYFPVVLSLASGECNIDITEMIYVYEVDARFGLFADSVEIADGTGMCEPLSATLVNQSSEEAQWRWYQNGRRFGASTEEVPVHWTNPSYSDSTFVISLAVTNEHNCYDSVSHQYVLFPSPHPLISHDTVICFGEDVNLWVMGGNSYHWDAPINGNSSVQTVKPTETTTYRVDVFSDKMCQASDSVTVNVILPVEASVEPDYASINIGDTVVSFILTESELNCRWSPTDSVFAVGCDTLYFFPRETTDYVVWLSDSLGCYESRFDIHIDVDMRFSLDVPGAFTPLSEGDGNNIVYVRGLGIKRLLQFRIFNRWGEEVFFSDDLNRGWDGTLKGKVQNIDTYSYYVEAEMYDGSIRTKKGNLMLIR
ncbi:MAG: PKD domain-containing protein [Bacteroidales bacterium]|nr:PKD domain-containing protein [Bacteroidales bacterium]